MTVVDLTTFCVVREKRLSLRKITDLETDGCVVTFDDLDTDYDETDMPLKGMLTM